jgi:hypothetical protein
LPSPPRGDKIHAGVVCPICLARTATQQHHLVPRCREWFHAVSVADVGKKAKICEPCHIRIHTTYTVDQLAAHYYTVGLLKSAFDTLHKEK